MENSARRLDWPIIGLFSLVHLVAFGTLIYAFFVEQFVWQTYVFAVPMFFICQISISSGMHLLYAHQGYRATYMLQCFYLVFAAATVQGTANNWGIKHKQHHGYVDGILDPHSPAQGGFWWAHIGWMLYRDVPEPPANILAGYRRKLEQYPLVGWQRRNYVWLAVGMGFVVPTAVASMWGDALGGLLVAGFVRLMLQYHATWSVNSVSHVFGERPYEGTATDGYALARPLTPKKFLLWALSILLAIVTVGESLHGTHHKYPYAMLGQYWYSVSPSKWFIVMCQYLSLASHVKFVPKTAR